jgi:hypothetical protein
MKSTTKRVMALLCGLAVSVACFGGISTIDHITNENVLVANANTDTPYYLWKQIDSQWADLTIANTGNRLSGYGCAVTSIAMLVAHSGLRDESNFDPGVFLTWLNNNDGFTSGGGIYWSAVSNMCPQFKYKDKVILDVDASDDEKFKTIKSYYDQGYYMAISVTNNYGTPDGHWVAVRAVKDGKVIMMDPGGQEQDLFSTYTGIHQIVLYSAPTPANEIAYFEVDEGNDYDDDYYYDDDDYYEEPGLFDDYSPVDIGDGVYAYIGVNTSSGDLQYLTNYNGRLFFKDLIPFEEKQIWYFEKDWDGSYIVVNYSNQQVLTFDESTQTLSASDYDGYYDQSFNVYSIDGQFYLNPMYTDYAIGISNYGSVTTNESTDYYALKFSSANLLGDTNNDKVLDYTDLFAVKKYVLGLSSTVSSLADMDQDGTTNVLDFAMLKHKVLG